MQNLGLEPDQSSACFWLSENSLCRFCHCNLSVSSRIFDSILCSFFSDACCSEMPESGADDISSRSRNVLLLGLSDDDEANRLDCRLYVTWDNLWTTFWRYVHVHILDCILSLFSSASRCHTTTASSAVYRRCRPPSSLVRGQESMMCGTVAHGHKTWRLETFLFY